MLLSFIVHMSLLVLWNVIMLDVRMSTKIVTQASTCDAREGFIISVEDKVAKIKRKAVPEKKTDNQLPLWWGMNGKNVADQSPKGV